MKRLFVFVNGILTWPGDSEGWTDRAVTWTHIHTDACAEKFEYFTGALTRRFRQQRRAEKLAKMLGFYLAQNRWQIHLVGHSNGTDVILRALDLLPKRPSRPTISTVHLIAAACDAHFRWNGLNSHLLTRTVGNVIVYVGQKDRALLAAHITGKLGRPFGLGYGSLGLTGPIEPVGNTTTIVEPTFGHSTWFEPQHFDALMKGITK